MKSRLAISTRGRRQPGAALGDDPQWYKDAIIYELRVRSFADSNSDGIGDFPGLTARLDYLKDLGVDTLWLLPICPSPGRDDGYDIADYTDISPELGTLEDVRVFLDEAHRRGLRVITELVLNHTSDVHPWFQRARRAPAGSPERDFFVWSEHPDGYGDARIIFKDFEPSNWSWDPVAKAYFWHRFYSHQPDLNFDNPRVHRALLDVVDFWFGLGVDGLRLDAVPYLYEREGTSCENLPETHAFLRSLRKHIDERWKNRVLLAEANQWPEDAAAYFGDGDECHMNFHFPIMPRIFMSIHMEDRLPIIDILAQTPKVPDTCQWALFLRNHDELTLEMVTDDERDYMYSAFARESSMRINLGIRRRLAPLAANDRRNIELMNGLLFSLPGTPVIYYGDEIGMGDNIYLGDRNGVRTPMQWSADRNAGFSRANPQRLVLPIIIDPEYHYESINVEAQQQNPSSLLWWTKRLIALRQRFRAFGRGTIEFLSPDNPHVLAFVRRYEDETVLVVANLSRKVQYVELDLARLEGKVPIELFGRTAFPPIGTLPYLLTLGAHAFYWFSIEEPETSADEVLEALYVPPLLELTGPVDHGMFGARSSLEPLLADYARGRRWFMGKARELSDVRIVDEFSLDAPGLPLAEEMPRVHLAIVRAEFSTGDPESYVIPLGIAEGDLAQKIRARRPQSVIAELHVREGAEPVPAAMLLFDALADPSGVVPAYDAIVRGLRNRGQGTAGTLVACSFEPLLDAGALLPARLPRREHKYTAAILDEKVVVKLYRRLPEGVSPELEIGRFLAARPEEVRGRHPAPTAPLLGMLELQPPRGEAITVATLLAFMPAEGTAASFFLAELHRYFERVLAAGSSAERQPERRFLERAGSAPPDAITDLIGNSMPAAHLLGRRIAELHRALSSETEDPAFAPEPYTALDLRSIYQTRRNLTGRFLRALRARAAHAPSDDAGRSPETSEFSRRLLAHEALLYRRFEPLLERRPVSSKIRVHGACRLESLLFTGKDFVALDLDGDPARRLSERRRKRTALHDLATLLRSFEALAMQALDDESAVRPGDRAAAESWVRVWLRWVPAACAGGYFAAARGSAFFPTDPAELLLLLHSQLLESALDELQSTLATDEARALIDLRSIVELLGLGAVSSPFN